jgi:hypothetical protein
MLRRFYAGKRMAPQVGLEPTTLRLTAGCSAIELLRSGETDQALRLTIGVHHSIPRRTSESGLRRILPSTTALLYEGYGAARAAPFQSTFGEQHVSRGITSRPIVQH